MRQREDSIKEIMDLLLAAKDDLDLNRLKYDPVAPVRADKLNAIHVHCGRDKVIKTSNKQRHGYPKTQSVQVIFESWLKENHDHVSFYQNFVKTVLSKPLSNGNKIEISGICGPFDGGVPGSKCFQVFTELQYTDYGPLAADN